MKILYLLGFLSCTILFYSSEGNKPMNTPKFLKQNISLDSVSVSEMVFEFVNPDSLLTHEMYLLKDKKKMPLAYYSDIQTPVCIDGICKPVRIEMYWNLLGLYIGFGVYPEELLTKYDHDLFEEKDYKKLHELLQDRYSVLDRKEMSSLYSLGEKRKDTIVINGVKLDGVTGATKKEIKNSIVEGALYSCFKLWHIANGEASREVKSSFSRIYNDALEASFLASESSDYQLYALQKLDSSSMLIHMERLINLISSGDPLLRSYILKKMPATAFLDEWTIVQLYKDIGPLDLNTRTLLLRRLGNSDKLASELISKQLKFLSKNQLKMYFKTLTDNKFLVDEKVIMNIEKYALDNSVSYGYLASEFMKKQ